MEKNNWLDQVQKFSAPGVDSVGGSLAVIAEAMEVEQPLPEGEIGGATIKLGNGCGNEYVVYLSKGSPDADIAHLADVYGVAPESISLRPAKGMLKVCFSGVASCVTQP